MANTVIIGAGLTGLSAAYHLEKRSFFDYKLFEKDSTVGGLCRSIVQDGFTFDYTGHLLHASDPYFRSFITELVGIQNLNEIYRKSFIYSQEKYTRYPYQINLFGLPEQTIVDCIVGFIQRKKKAGKKDSFHDWVLKTFGEGFAKHFFFPFQHKIFSYDLKKISSSWTGRFVPETSLEQMIIGALKDNFDDKIGYNAQFFYPKQGGINFWINQLSKVIQNNIYTNSIVSRINLKTKTIYFNNGDSEQYDKLINTMPLDVLISLLDESSVTAFKPALRHLLCNSVVNFNIGISDRNISEKHWIYFPESHFPFYRIGFPHNFSAHMVPSGCSSLYGEFSYIKKSAAGVKETLDQALKDVKKICNISDAEIITEKIITISHAYVIYDFWREKNLPKLLAALKEHDIHSIGRYGEWKYSSMQEAVLDGKKIAESITIMPATQARGHAIVSPGMHKHKEFSHV